MFTKGDVSLQILITDSFVVSYLNWSHSNHFKSLDTPLARPQLICSLYFWTLLLETIASNYIDLSHSPGDARFWFHPVDPVYRKWFSMCELGKLNSWQSTATIVLGVILFTELRESILSLRQGSINTDWRQKMPELELPWISEWQPFFLHYLSGSCGW